MASKINIVISAEDKASEPLRRVKGATDDLSDSSGKFSKVYSAVAKTSAVVAGAAGAAAGKFVLWNGAMRALNIEDAQAKLRGLGHDGEAVGRIMASALDSVKGTAYGLDAAATTAATAVAAGVKPGKELTYYLKNVADAANIAGTDLSYMGNVFNQVQTIGAAYNDSLRVLAERGLPVYTWLAKEMGVTEQAVKNLASEGRISSEKFYEVVNKNIGGAALASGETTRGAWENMKAAMARVGADIAKDIIPEVRGAMGDMTKWFDSNSEMIVYAAKDVVSVFRTVATGALGMGKGIYDLRGVIVPAVVAIVAFKAAVVTMSATVAAAKTGACQVDCVRPLVN